MKQLLNVNWEVESFDVIGRFEHNGFGNIVVHSVVHYQWVITMTKAFFHRERERDFFEQGLSREHKN